MIKYIYLRNDAVRLPQHVTTFRISEGRSAECMIRGVRAKHLLQVISLLKWVFSPGKDKDMLYKKVFLFRCVGSFYDGHL